MNDFKLNISQQHNVHRHYDDQNILVTVKENKKKINFFF